MAKANGKPRLVAVEALPERKRRSLYGDIVAEFKSSRAKVAKIEGAKSTAMPSIKKAVATYGGGKVAVQVRNGEVYLTKE